MEKYGGSLRMFWKLMCMIKEWKLSLPNSLNVYMNKDVVGKSQTQKKGEKLLQNGLIKSIVMVSENLTCDPIKKTIEGSTEENSRLYD